MIYLDNASTTEIDGAVLEEMLPYLKDRYGNAGNIYKLGRESMKAISNARRKVADFINASPEQIIFTSGGTESNNTVIRQICSGNMICSDIEHDSVIEAMAQHSMSDGISTTIVPVRVDSGTVNPLSLMSAIDKETKLVSIMYVNNELGTVNPVRELAEICHEKNVLFHTDCVQAAACKKIDVKKIGCDFLSISGHKIHAPKGIGALYVKDIKKLRPLIVGGKAQENGLRGSTQNVASIVALGKACELQNIWLKSNSEAKYSEFAEIFKRALAESKIDFKINCESSKEKTNKVLSITIPGIDGESLVLMLDTKDVCISSGSACKAHETKASRVLKAIGLSDEEAHNTVRISFGKYNTVSEVETAARLLVNQVETLRRIKL